MFQAFKRTWIAVFGTLSNLAEATEFLTESARTLAEEVSLTTKLESGANVSQLQKQLALLD